MDPTGWRYRAHFDMKARDWLTLTFPDWIVRCGHVQWSPPSLDISPLDLSFGGMPKEKMHTVITAGLMHWTLRIN